MVVSPRLFSWKTYGLAFAIALSPALMQTEPTCAQPGDTTLSDFKFEVLGENHIDFDPDERVYHVWLPSIADTADVVAYSTDTAAEVSYEYRDAAGTLIDAGWFSSFNGGGEMTLDGLLPQGESVLRVFVKTPGTTAARNYTAIIQVGCSDCDDGNACTQDACDPTLDMCVHPSGGCQTACTEQGLRDAIAAGGGPYTFDCAVPSTIETAAEIVIDNDVILSGEGRLTIDANGMHRVLTVSPGVTAVLQGLTITGGLGGWPDPNGGGGLLNFGTLTVRDSTISLNRAGPYDTDGGGGIFNDGVLTLTRSTVSHNYGFCGNVYNSETATLTVVNSSISSSYYGGLCPFGTASLAQTTIHDLVILRTSSDTTKSADDLTLANTVVYGRCVQCQYIPRAGEWYCGNDPGVPTPVVTSTGHNIESPGDSCGFGHSTDRANVAHADLQLGPLANNGGSQQTHSLFGGSTAIDVVSSSMCVDPDGAPLTIDQRGIARPQGDACDIGAFEYVDCSGSPCDDGNACTADHCDPDDGTWCVHTDLPDGSSCDFGGASGVCVASECVETSWGRAERIASGGWGSWASGPAVAVTPEGEVTVVWCQGSVFEERVWANRYTPGVGWGTAEQIQTLDTYIVRSPLVEVDPAGRVTALWHGSITTTSEGIFSNRYTPGEGWGAVDESAGGGFVVEGHDLAVDPYGDAIAVWAELFNGRYNIWSSRYRFGWGWVGEESVGYSGLQPGTPQVVVDAAGYATAVWVLQNDIWSNRYHYTPGAAGGYWDAPELVETNAGVAAAPRLDVDDSGIVTAVWRQYDEAGARQDAWTNRYTPGVGWGTAELIETDDAEDATGLVLAVGPNGHAAAVWVYSDGVTYTADETWWNRYTPGAGWGLAEPLGYAPNPRVAVDATGHATIVWVSGNDVWSNRYAPGAGWGTAVPIEGNSAPDASASSPQVTVDASGQAVAAWSQVLQPWGFESLGTIWANHSDAPAEVTP